MNTRIFATMLMSAFLTISAATAVADESFEGAARDAWVTGKIEAVYTLNSHLNPFAIDTHVENGVVTLTGVVESDIDRDLAEELAKGIEGVVEVNNDLTVDRESQRSENQGSDFGAWVADVTTTATVKSKLIANEHIEGLKIDVTTQRHVVTLDGHVGSEEQRELAEEIASNTGNVARVQNNLIVDPNA